MLAQILTTLEEKPGAGVIFDLDSTLFDNGPRTWRILYEFAHQHRTDLVAPLGQMSPYRLPYALSEICERLKPGEGQTIADQALSFWKARFFVDDYIDFDEPIAGAVDYVNACHERGARVIYLTGRDVPGMMVGTARSLRNWGFPIAVAGTELILKPTFEMSDVIFKADVIRSIKRQTPTVVATFENEAKNAMSFREHWPEATHLLLDTKWDPAHPAELRDQFTLIPDFQG